MGSSNIKTRRENFCFNNLSIRELRINILERQMEIALDLRNKDFISAQKRIHSFIRSENSRALAVYETISKKGYRSKGFSKVKPKTMDDYNKLIKQLWYIIKNPKKYKATPLARTLIPKPKGGTRPISVPSYLDRALQHLYRMILDVIHEEVADPNSYGFRPFRSPGWAAKAITLSIWSRKGRGIPNYCIKFDIKKCFDSISHKWILDNISDYKIENFTINLIPHHILSEWLTCGYIIVDKIKNKFSLKNLTVLPTTGVPQGGPISPVITNLVLNGIEMFVKTAVNDNRSPERISDPQVDKWSSLIRYVDDIILFAYNYRDIEIATKAVKAFLYPRGLEINDEKTIIKCLPLDYFDFVGFRISINLEKGKYAIYNYPSDEVISKLMKKIINVMNENARKQDLEKCFIKINSILTGWTNFYRCGNSKNAFCKVNFRLWHRMLFHLKRIYMKTPEFCKKDVPQRKKRLMQTIFRNHIKPYGTFKQWFYIDKFSLSNIRYKNLFDLFLICPSQIAIGTPSIISYRNKDTFCGLSAFHPVDRNKLSEKSLK
jgi:RNA-directed DNA polymerase